MRSVAALAAIVLLTLSCNGNAGDRPSPAESGTPSASPSGSPAVASYGLLLTAGTLEMISPSGAVAAHATVAAPSVHTCGQSTGAVLQPPVSASDNKVYYRDGNTKIKFLTPDGQTGDVTTVPGSATKVSFFSVSPDDSRIAVLVEDLSPSTTIKLSLYVEDLTGHNNHSVIFTNTVPKFKNATTLWPMGWHNGLLVLAVFPPCTFEPAGLVPIEWHVSNAVTAVRVAKIGNPCIPSYWPSPAGVLCLDLTVDVGGLGAAYAYDWAGNGKMSAYIPVQKGRDFQSGLSPSGQRYFMTPGQGIGAPAPSTKIGSQSTLEGTVVAGHSACLWIDDDHLLAPDSVIAVQTAPAPLTPTAGNVSPTATPRHDVVLTASVTALPASGLCAGRFPGGL
jgi:hypothetical protein